MSEAESASPSPRVGGTAPATARRGRPPRRCGPGRRARRRAARRRARALEDLALLRRRRREECGVDARQRVGDRLALGPLEQRRELDQLEVAHDAVGDVEVGVEAQLAQPRADARTSPSSSSRSAGTSRAASRRGRRAPPRRLPRRAERRARLLGERRRRLRRAAVGALGVGEHERLARARHRDVQQPAHLGDVRRAGVGRGSSAARRDRLAAAPARARHPRGLQPADEDVVELQARGPRASSARAPGPVPAAPPASRLVVAQPGVGHGGERSGRTRAAWPAARGARSRRRARPGARQLDEPLDDVGLRGEQLLAAQPEAVDEPVDEEVGPRRVERGGRRRWSLRKREDALARLGRQLRRLGRGDERATMSSLRRRPRSGRSARGRPTRSSIGGRASARTTAPASDGVDEQPQPGEHVADLGALEERRRADEPVGQRALLERDGDRRPSSRTERTSTAIRSGGRPRGRAARPRRRRPGPARARSRSARSARRPLGAADSSARGRPVGDRRDDRPARREDALAGSGTIARGATTGASGWLRRNAVVLRPAVPAPRRSAWSSSATRRRRRRSPAPPAVPRPSSSTTSSAAGERSWRSSTSTWRQRAPTRARTCGRSRSSAGRAARGRRRPARPARRAAGRGRGRAGRTRARARRARPQARGPRRELAGASTHLVLEPVDARDDARRAARPGCRAKSWRRSVSSSTRSSSSASRSARRQRHDERVEPGLERLVAQQPRAEVVDGVDRELLERRASSASSTCRRSAAGARPRCAVTSAGRTRARRRRPTSQAKRSTSTRVLPVPGPPRTSSGPPRASTTRRCAGDRFGSDRGLRPQAHDPATRSMGRVTAEAIVLEADWLGACRRAAAGCASVLSDHPTSRERVVETGERGEGGDRTLVIDARPRTSSSPSSSASTTTALRFSAVSEERGIVDFGSDGRPSSSSTRSTAR